MTQAPLSREELSAEGFLSEIAKEVAQLCQLARQQPFGLFLSPSELAIKNTIATVYNQHIAAARIEHEGWRGLSDGEGTYACEQVLDAEAHGEDHAAILVSTMRKLLPIPPQQDGKEGNGRTRSTDLRSGDDSDLPGDQLGDSLDVPEHRDVAPSIAVEEGEHPDFCRCLRCRNRPTTNAPEQEGEEGGNELPCLCGDDIGGNPQCPHHHWVSTNAPEQEGEWTAPKHRDDRSGTEYDGTMAGEQFNDADYKPSPAPATEDLDDTLDWLKREAKWHFQCYGQGNFAGKGLEKAAAALAASQAEVELWKNVAQKRHRWALKHEADLAAAEKLNAEYRDAIKLGAAYLEALHDNLMGNDADMLMDGCDSPLSIAERLRTALEKGSHDSE